MPAGRVENIGEAIFGGLGKGLNALAPLLIQAQQQNMANIQLQMKVEENRLSNERMQQLIDAGNKSPAEFGREKAEEEQAQIQAGLFGSTLQGTEFGGILEALGAQPGGENAASTPQLLDIIGTQTGQRPILDIEGFAPQPKKERFDLNTFLIESLGEKRFLEFKTGTGEFSDGKTRLELIEDLFGKEGLIAELDPSKVSPAEERIARTDREKRGKADIFAEAAEVYRNLPLEIKQELEIGELLTPKDLSKALIAAGIAGKKESLFTVDWLYRDKKGLPEAFTKLQNLAKQLRNVGTTLDTGKITDEEITEAIRRKRGK